MSKSSDVSHIFTLARTFQIYNKINLLLYNVGQGRRVQFSQLHHSVANVKIYKYLLYISALALTVSEI